MFFTGSFPGHRSHTGLSGLTHRLVEERDRDVHIVIYTIIHAVLRW